MHVAAQDFKKENEFYCVDLVKMHIQYPCSGHCICSHVGRERDFGIDVEWPARQGANLERLVFSSPPECACGG